MNITTLSTLVSVIAAIGGGGYWVAKEVATHEEVQVAESKADFSLDKHQEYILEQINRLELKKQKSPDDLEQLRYLRDELKRLREVRKGS